MALEVGRTPDHGFDAPFGLLGDCHRRIERFLAGLRRVSDEADGGALDERQREGLEKALRYFRDAAPWHTADEEESLFPRLRACEAGEVHETLARMEALEDDHRRAASLHRTVDELGDRWLERDGLGADDLRRLREALDELETLYRAHIAFEDEILFPVAARHLDDGAIRAMGAEMASRRGLDTERPAPRCRHAQGSKAESTDA